MSKDGKEAKQDYVIERINEALSASRAGEDVLQKFSDMDSADEAGVRRAEMLFGNRDSYLREIDRLIAETHLIFTCASHEESVEYVAGEIVDFVDKARNVLDARNPFRKERAALVRYQNYTDAEFADGWPPLHKSLNATYRREQLNVEFYDRELSAASVGSADWTLTRYELQKDWERQLLIKEIDFELNMLSALRRKFYGVFREKLNDFRQVADSPHFDAAQIGLFWSLSAGTWRMGTFDLMAKYAALIHKNKSVQRFLAELGREGFRDGAELINAKKEVGEIRFPRSQKSDIYGITESDDLFSLLPMEVAMLSESALENDFYKRFTEKKLRTFSYQSKVTRYIDAVEEQIRLEEEKCGPFIVCIDTSGSMSGIPEELAKTICYGLIVKSQEQHRNCFVITFSTDVEVLDISDLKNNSKTIMDFLMHTFDGGTDFSPAMAKAMEMLTDERYGKADILFISDFIAGDFDYRLGDAIRSANSRRTRLHALQIGDFSNDKLLCRFDMIWEYRTGQIYLKKDITSN